MNKILIFGGTGFIGKSLAKHLKAHGLEPVLIARNKPESDEFRFVEWDAVNLGNWVKDLEGAQAVVNLTGRSVDCIKTPDNCDVILRSRIDSTHIIGKAFEKVENPPKVWVQMSTAHIYGDPPKQWCTENSATGYGFAPFVGLAWEKAFMVSLPQNVRGVRLRTSFVIGKNGGALESLVKIVKMGLGGSVGHGNQGISWIHEYDMNEIILQSIIDSNYKGIYIATAPNPVSNREFMQELRIKLKVGIGISAPNFITRFGAKYIFKTDPELAIYGRYLKSERLEKQGFNFKYPELHEALDHIFYVAN